MQMCGELDMLSFVRISSLSSTGHANRMDSKRKVSQILNNNNSQGIWQRGWQKTDCETVYKLILKDAKLKTGKKGKKDKADCWLNSINEAKVIIGL